MFTLKPNVIASLNANASSSKRSAIISKHKTESNGQGGEAGSASASGAQNIAIAGSQGNS